MAFRPAPDHTPVLETEYVGRFPTMSDLTRQGGIPGYIYYLAHAAHIGEYQRQGADMVRDLQALTITGPRGTASAFLMCKGAPIAGADPRNGVRRYFIDPLLVEATGIGEETTNAETQSTEGQAEGREGDARIQGGNAPQLVGQQGEVARPGGRDRAQRTAGVREATPPQHAE